MSLRALLFTLAFCAYANSQVVSSVSTSSPSGAYIVGEKLSYSVSFSNFPTAAHVELLVAGRGQFSGREGIELRAHVETIGVVNAALYSINNDYVTFVDASSGLPYRAQQVIREGMRTEDISSDLNTPVGASALPATPSGAGPGMFDFLSALYRLRALPLEVGGTHTITAQQGTRVFNVEVKVSGREVIKTNVGSSNCLVTELRVRNDSDADRYRTRIYFTADDRHIPVLITAKHRSGEIRIELASAEFVKELTAPLLATGTPKPPGITLPPAGANSQPPPAMAGPGPATGSPAVAAPLPALPFDVGEPLNFNFYIGRGTQPVGSASFLVRARANYFNRDGLLLTSTMQTTGAMQGLFPVRDQINSYVDARTLLPFRTELNLFEGKRQNKWVVSLNQDGGNALFDDGTRVEIPVGTHDLLSVLYALRSFDLTPSRKNAVSILINKRPRLLQITALRRETIELGGQQIPAVELSLITDDKRGDQLSLRLWVSTDRRRIPLRITAVTPLGPVRADLAIIPTSLQ